MGAPAWEPAINPTHWKLSRSWFDKLTTNGLTYNGSDAERGNDENAERGNDE